MRWAGRPLDPYYRRLSAYVMQSDVLFPHLTVRETLMYAAQLRLPATISDTDKFKRVGKAR
jgi:ABC-type multidrug transport system ATPase subunit